MKTRKMVNEGRVISAVIMLQAPISITLVILNANIWGSTFLRAFLCGYSVALLLVATVQFIVANINLRKSRKDADEYLQKMLAAVKEAQEKVKENEKEGK